MVKTKILRPNIERDPINYYEVKSLRKRNAFHICPFLFMFVTFENRTNDVNELTSFLAIIIDFTHLIKNYRHISVCVKI